MHSWDLPSSRNNSKKVTAEKKASRSLYLGETLHRKHNYLDVTALIRSLQRAEGENDCFRTSGLKCQRADCRWREYCFDKS